MLDLIQKIKGAYTNLSRYRLQIVHIQSRQRQSAAPAVLILPLRVSTAGYRR